MYKPIQRALKVIALLCGVTVGLLLAQTTGTSAAGKMSSQQMMEKMNHMSTAEKAAMFDNVSNSEKMHAMKMAGHDMSQMSHKEKMDMMDKLTSGQKAEMFDKMPMDTKMSTMRMSMKEHGANRTGK
jgi:hypothetical protein